MYRIKTMNKIASAGLDQLDKSRFQVGEDVENEDGILVRSAKMHDYVFPDALRAIARAGAGGLGLVRLGGLGEDQHAGHLAGAVGEHDGAADLLVGVTGVNAQLHVQLDGLVELGLGGLGDELEGFLRLVLSLLINELSALFIIFTSEQFSFLLIKWFVGWMILPRSGSEI